MRILPTMAVLVAAALVSTSAPAQSDSGQTETQQRRTHPGSEDLIWNLLGALGLVGLTGIWRSSDNDGYTNDPI